MVYITAIDTQKVLARGCLPECNYIVHVTLSIEELRARVD